MGPSDYVLFIDRKPVGVIEAKRAEEGVHLVTEVENQSFDYASAKLKYLSNDLLPFVYEAPGKPKPRSRNIFKFYRPATFAKWIKEAKTLRARFFELPKLNPV